LYHQIELYFVDDEDFGPFSPRNEIGSLNLMLRIIDSLLCTASHQAIQVLQELRNITLSKVNLVELQSAPENHLTIDGSFNNTEEDNLLVSWAKNNGVRSKLNIARKFFFSFLFTFFEILNLYNPLGILLYSLSS
jgi:protein-histidine N-methyltransferase